METEEFLSRNRIYHKTIDNVTEEEKKSAKLFEKSKSFDFFYGGNLDDLMDSLDYPITKEFFDVVLAETKDYQDLFEPCCMSGLLGCFAASEKDNVSYVGIDINDYAIEKAQSRAHINGLNPEIFIKMDKADYKNLHEAIIGRYVANNFLHGQRDLVDEEAMDFLSKTSDNIVLIARAPERFGKYGFEQYKASFKRHGYKNIEIVSNMHTSEFLEADLFVMKATK